MILQCNVILHITAAILESNSTKIKTNKNCTITQHNKTWDNSVKNRLQKN